MHEKVSCGGNVGVLRRRTGPFSFFLETLPMNESAVLEFWRDYLDGPPPDLDQEPKLSGVFSFGDSKKLADELAALVRQGIKTATCSALMGCEKASGSLIILARPLVLQSSRAADREMQTMDSGK